MSSLSGDAGIIGSRASIVVAKSARLLESWLPPKTGQESQPVKTIEELEELEKGEEKIYTAAPETLGLGAPLPEVKDGDFNRLELASNHKLLRQLLGSDSSKRLAKSKQDDESIAGQMSLGSKPQPAWQSALVDDEQDEGGRSSLGKSKRKRVGDNQEPEQGEIDDDGGTHIRPTKPKRTTNYLDEMLAEKQRKKEKKLKRKKSGADHG